ncbi:hypothetical protein L1049_027789 [Liquidambar formosana]|uniref:Uncharacterized protein n=1 Tax=Liquidambar formosana TaxID=63359 RepID=A0AAP0WSS7_LIQFO
MSMKLIPDGIKYLHFWTVALEPSNIHSQFSTAPNLLPPFILSPCYFIRLSVLASLLQLLNESYHIIIFSGLLLIKVQLENNFVDLKECFSENSTNTNCVKDFEKLNIKNNIILLFLIYTFL